MKNTGERHIISENITNKAELYNHFMHIATYKFAEKYAKGKKVLDFGCGSGYGSFELSKVAEHVTAVDISAEAIDFANENYKNDNLSYCMISELSQEKFDIITSFQVIEHVPNDKEYVKKLKNLLTPGGYLIISTPDKSTRLFDKIQKPWNIFHLKEYSTAELYKLLTKYFFSIETVKIGSDKDFVLLEINRCKKQKLITLPCTLFFYPNFVRIFLLKVQSKFYSLLLKFTTRNKSIKKFEKNNNSISNYSIEDIKFDNNLKNSTDLLVICRKQN